MGARIPSTGLWCDAPGAVHLTVVTHAGIRTRARRIITTRLTAILAGLEERDVLTPSQGASFALGKLRLTLLDSGWGPGSVMLLCEHPAGARTLFVSRIGRSGRAGIGEPEAPHCDTLIIDPGDGDPLARGPGTVGEEDLDAWLRGVATARDLSVLLVGMPLGLARIAGALSRTELDLTGTRAIIRAASRLARAGIALPHIGERPRTPRPGTLEIAPLGHGRPARCAGARLAAVVDPCEAHRGVAEGTTVFDFDDSPGPEGWASFVEATDATTVQMPSSLDPVRKHLGARASSIRWLIPPSQLSLACAGIRGREGGSGPRPRR